MKILSSFTHPQVFPNLYDCLCSAGHTWRYSEECGKQSRSGAPLTSIVLIFLLLWKSMVPQNSLVTNFLQNIFLLCSAEKRLFIQVWNYLRVSKWWQNCHFWVNYTSKISFFFSVFFFIIIVEQHSLNLNPWHFTWIKLEIKRIRKADEFLIPTLTVDLTVIMYWLTVLVLLCWEISGVSAEALCAVWTRCLL